MVSDERHWEIEELIHRRTDLSTFVIHWSRDFDGKSAQDNLISILKDSKIAARTPMGAAVKKLEEQPDGEDRERALTSQKVVCFTEAPLEQAWSFVSYIHGRQVQLQPYGLAFTKRTARRLGVNPVWYVDMTPSGHEWLMNDISSLVDRAIGSGGSGLRTFHQDPIARIAPFVEGMGTWEAGRKEFWWEREWRYRGDLLFDLDHLAVVLCPESDTAAFVDVARPSSADGRGQVPLIDPHWGLEHIIAALAGVPEDDRRSV